MIVIAQIISTAWSKKSRGQPLATRRNRVPERILLPPKDALRRGQCMVHRVRYSEINGFGAPVVDTIDVYEEVQSPLTAAVGVYLADGMLQVVFEGAYPYDAELPGIVHARMGAPGGRTVPHRPFALALDEWGQIRYMGRLITPWTAFTYYEKWVYNIGLFSAFSPRVFLDTQPRRRFESMPNVW